MAMLYTHARETAAILISPRNVTSNNAELAGSCTLLFSDKASNLG